MGLFVVSCCLIVIAVFGIVDVVMPDDDFWGQFDD